MTTITKRNIEAIYPLSPMQHGMLFHSLYAPDSGVYVEQLTCTLQGKLDYAAFVRAWQCVVDRHAILRTAFAWRRTEKPLQVVHKQVSVPVAPYDWRDRSQPEQEAALAALRVEDRACGFDLSQVPLMRLHLARVADETYHFVWTSHHLLLDGWSLPLLLREVFTLYEAFSRGEVPRLPPARPYRDYIGWLQKQDLVAAEVFWRSALRGFTAPTPLTVDHATGETGYGRVDYRIPAPMTAQLQTLARQHQLTLNTLVQGAWALVLHRYCGEEDIVFGATVAGRPAELPGVETMVGLFINTLPVRVQIDPQQPLLTWLSRLQAQQFEQRQFEYTPLFELQRWSEVPRDQPLFESLLIFENYPVDASLREQQSAFRVSAVQMIEQTNYPLNLAVGPGREVGLTLHYDRVRLSADSVERMMGHLATVLAGFAENIQCTLAKVPMLTPTELSQLAAWNDTAVPFLAEHCIHQVIAGWAAKQPDYPALRYDGITITYAQLDQRANQLAHVLQARGIRPDTLVGIALPRSPDFVIAALATLKAGGAFLPLDLTYPMARLQFMLADSCPAILIAQPDSAAALIPDSLDIPLLDPADPALDLAPVTPPVRTVCPAHLAYVIYTSGSTGKPKGALLSHQGLLNLALWQSRAFDVTPDTRVIQFAALSFDAAVWELVLALANGATLIVATPEQLTPGAPLRALLQRERVSIATLPPSLLAILDPNDLPDLAVVIAAGEASNEHIVRRWAAGRRFINGYGPTETTVCASWHVCDPAASGPPPIGRPITNTRLYVLDSQQQRVPVGVAGELYIGGIGVARGYLNRPELTAERFVQLPDLESGRLYRTGDRVRWQADGTLVFMGRIDHQVKLRGFRIELGEIESALRQYPGIQDAVAIVREDTPGDPRLVAYIVPDAADKPEAGSITRLISALREHLAAQLPHYMIPAAIISLDAWPLTPNGKVDRKALPSPAGSLLFASADFAAPRTPSEDLLAGMWVEILSLPRVSRTDNFFELGGHSLLATRLLSRLRETFQVELPMRAIFETANLAELASRIDALCQEHAGLLAPAIMPVARNGDLPLSFAQQRLWFLDQLEPGSPLYNNFSAVRLAGSLDLDALEASLIALVQRHESLRTVFASRDGLPVQIIQPAESRVLTVPLIDLCAVAEDALDAEIEQHIRREAAAPIDLANGPLLRLQLLRLADQEHIALLTVHHIISDGWSMGVFVGELFALYAEATGGPPAQLAALRVHYADFAAWQRGWLQGAVLEQQLAFWKQQLSDMPTLLELPTDRPRPPVQSFRGGHQPFAFSAEQTQALHRLSRQEQSTLFIVVLAAFQSLLYRYSGQERFGIGTPIANRTRAEIEPLIGFFVNTLVLSADLRGAPSFRELLRRVRETALGAYAHQDLPFEMLVEALQPERSLAYAPLFQVMFVMNNTPVQARQLPDLLISPVHAESGLARFDMTLELWDAPEGLAGSLEYNADLFDPATIERMLGHFTTLLEAVCAAPDQLVTRLPLLSPAEQQQLTVGWNQTTVPFPADLCAHQMIAQWAAVQPDHLAAMMDGGSTLSYAQLDAQANQLAHTLQRYGIGSDTLVAIALPRSLDLVVAILATLKAGGAFLPLDLTYPAERLRFMLEDAQPAVLLTLQALNVDLWAGVAGQPVRVLLDRDIPSIATEPIAPPPCPATPDSLAYVIYTSGSTGTPKGTLLAHRGLVNLATWQRGALAITPDSRVLQFAALSFDAAVWEYVMALGNGATLVLADQETLADGSALLRLLRDQAITTVTLPPSLLAVLESAALPQLSTVVAAGEACSQALVQSWAPGRNFFNAYGPTETTVCASAYRCDSAEDRSPPIGRPINNFQLYVLDPQQQLVPVGVPGELYIGGVGVARGYLNRPELSAERFVELSDGALPPEAGRLYRTGDLVRWRADGNIEFLGRLDQQVKLRGFRIELGEIAAVLRSHPAVADALVLARGQGSAQQLVGYVVLSEAARQVGEAVAPSALLGDLRSHLGARLPAYMLPAALVPLEAWPLTPSGKVDRAALPAPDQMVLQRAYVAPSTPTETMLVTLAQEILGLEQIGITDNFFELGGHSLLGTQLIARIRTQSGIELPLRALFEQPTVVGLAALIDNLAMQKQSEADSIAELMAQIGSLSDEEVRALLASQE